MFDRFLAPDPRLSLSRAPPAAPPESVADPSAPVPAGLVAAPELLTPASASSPQAASATTGGPASLVAPPVGDPAAPVVPPTAPVAQPSRPPSPGRRPSRPHSPAPHQDREAAPHAVVAHAAPRQAVLPENPPPDALVPHQIPAPSAHAASASAPVPGSWLRLPPVPPVAGVEFVAARGETQYPHPRVGGSATLALEEPFLAQALQPPQSRVPEATLAQLFRLAESFHALLLIQVLAHSSLPAVPPETFQDRHRESCLDAADQLAVLLAPMLAAPAEGGVAAAGQLHEAVRSLRRHLRAGSGAAVIGASTLVVRELWRTLTGVLHSLGAHRM
ncbi:unnamed protein product [Closterium sp. Naga37s-1]|nr:unnamed protein product [Closterium sp. Naga37s-1]